MIMHAHSSVTAQQKLAELKFFCIQIKSTIFVWISLGFLFVLEIQNFPGWKEKKDYSATIWILIFRKSVRFNIYPSNKNSKYEWHY